MILKISNKLSEFICSINSALLTSNVKIEKFISEECTYILSVEVIYDYKNHEKNIKNLKSLLSLTVIKDGDSMILKSINKEEL